MKIADFSCLFVAHRVAALICLLHGRWKKIFKQWAFAWNQLCFVVC